VQFRTILLSGKGIFGSLKTAKITLIRGYMLYGFGILFRRKWIGWSCDVRRRRILKKFTNSVEKRFITKMLQQHLF